MSSALTGPVAREIDQRLRAALAPTLSGYMAARFFQGLGVAPGATVGLAAINDMFYEHERGQKIGLWVLAMTNASVSSRS